MRLPILIAAFAFGMLAAPAAMASESPVQEDGVTIQSPVEPAPNAAPLSATVMDEVEQAIIRDDASEEIVLIWT